MKTNESGDFGQPRDKPIVALAMGDPAGIGPELIVKVLSNKEIYGNCLPIVVGDLNVLKSISSAVGSEIKMQQIERVSDARFKYKTLDVISPGDLHLDHVVPGKLCSEYGRSAALCLEFALELSKQKQVQGIVSAPLNKQAFHQAGYHFRDELEFLKTLAKAPETHIIGIAEGIWTIAASEHIPFKMIPDMIKRGKIVHHITILNEMLERAGLHTAKIGVAALNVHGGEGGLFGNEEVDEIAPAIKDARDQGINVQGPIPADTIFVRATTGEFNGVVSMYHDQANIARKLIARRRGATLFTGLPVPVATTAHGTAFDIAWQGIAEPGSLEEALEIVSRIASSP